MTDDWPFDPLIPLSYDLIMVDCPWHFELYSEEGNQKSAQGQYETMNLMQLSELPVGKLARGDALVFMWATFPLLPEALVILKHWGFRYVTGGAWHKRTRHGKTAFGTGYRVRSAVEPWLLGVVGNPFTSRSHRNLIEGLARQHSRKPEEAYTWLETYMPNAVRRADFYPV